MAFGAAIVSVLLDLCAESVLLINGHFRAIVPVGICFLVWPLHRLVQQKIWQCATSKQSLYFEKSQHKFANCVEEQHSCQEVDGIK